MIVADTNTIAYLFIQGVHTPAVEALLEADPGWCAPPLWRSEFRNTLALYIRLGAMSLKHAQRLMKEAEALLRNREFRVESAEVLRLTKESGCSACDCEFVALARDLGAPLVTSDKAVLRAFPDIALAPEAFVNS